MEKKNTLDITQKRPRCIFLSAWSTLQLSVGPNHFIKPWIQNSGIGLFELWSHWKGYKQVLQCVYSRDETNVPERAFSTKFMWCRYPQKTLLSKVWMLHWSKLCNQIYLSLFAPFRFKIAQSIYNGSYCGFVNSEATCCLHLLMWALYSRSLMRKVFMRNTIGNEGLWIRYTVYDIDSK